MGKVNHTQRTSGKNLLCPLLQILQSTWCICKRHKSIQYNFCA